MSNERELFAKTSSGSIITTVIFSLKSITNKYRVDDVKGLKMMFIEFVDIISLLPQDIALSLLYHKECNKPVYYPRAWSNRLKMEKCKCLSLERDELVKILEDAFEGKENDDIYWLINKVEEKCLKHIEELEDLVHNHYTHDELDTERHGIYERIRRLIASLKMQIIARIDASGLYNIWVGASGSDVFSDISKGMEVEL